MKVSKRILLGLLVLTAILVVAVPSVAGAADWEAPGTVELRLAGAVQDTVSFKAAVETFADYPADAIVLLDDIEVPGDLEIIVSINVKIDLNGHDLSVDGDFIRKGTERLQFVGDAGDSVLISGDLIAPDLISEIHVALDQAGIAVTVLGKVVSSGDGVYVSGGGGVLIEGGVQVDGDGVCASGISDLTGNPSHIQIGSPVASASIVSSGTGAAADRGGQITVFGDINAHVEPHRVFGFAIIVEGEGSIVKVHGSVNAVFDGLWALTGATVDVVGNVTSSEKAGMYVYQASASIGGNVHSVHEGVYALSESEVYIGGNVISTEPESQMMEAVPAICAYSDTLVVVDGNVTSAAIGVEAGDGGKVQVGGNVTAATDGVWAYNSSEVTVDGKIVSDDYIVILDSDGEAYLYSPEDFTEPTTKAGYRTYTNAPDDSFSTVWVKIPASDNPDPDDTGLPTKTPPTGDTAQIALWLSVGIASALSAAGLTASKRREG